MSGPMRIERSRRARRFASWLGAVGAAAALGPAGAASALEPEAAAPVAAQPASDAPAARDGSPRPVILPPRALSDTRVEYPEGASGEAMVELELSIDASGSVERAIVLAGTAPFAEAARAAAQRWTFEPARRGGMPMAARIRFRVGFEQRSIAVRAPDAAGARG
ncbi:MAG TPA: TonB family protein, partial [Polyangiaceae bacterium]|nr:TonB family protein [Polyangiaceae bacterium]